MGNTWTLLFQMVPMSTFSLLPSSVPFWTRGWFTSNPIIVGFEVTSQARPADFATSGAGSTWHDGWVNNMWGGALLPPFTLGFCMPLTLGCYFLVLSQVLLLLALWFMDSKVSLELLYFSQRFWNLIFFSLHLIISSYGIVSISGQLTCYCCSFPFSNQCLNFVQV